MTDTLPMYVDRLGVEHGNPWVDVIYIQWVDEREDPDLYRLVNATFPDFTAIADYLAQWDYGQETDDAHTSDADPSTADRWATVEWVEIGGVEYVLTVNRPLGTYSLSRRPLDWDVTAYRHAGHETNLSGAWFCDTCHSPYCVQS